MNTDVNNVIEENSNSSPVDCPTEKANDIDLARIEALKKSLEVKAEELQKWQDSLSEKENSLAAEEIRIQKGKAALEEKEKNIETELKLKIDAEYTQAMALLNDEQNQQKVSFLKELEARRGEFEKDRQKAISELSRELDSLRENAQKEIDNNRRIQELKLKKDREETEAELQKLRQDNKAEIKSEREKALKDLETEIEHRTAELTRGKAVLLTEQERVKAADSRIEKMEKELAQREDDLTDKVKAYERDKRRLEREKSRIDEANDNLTEVVNQKIEDTLKNNRHIIATKDQELDNLRGQLSSAMKEIELVKSFREAYGDDPQAIIQRIKQLEEEKATLRNKLSNSSDKSELDRISTAYRETKAEL